MERAAESGCKIVVIGSGKARYIPENFSREYAASQFCEIMDICGEIGKDYCIKIAIEPLNYDETNYINTVAEGLEFCRTVANSNVGVLADFYHIYKTGELI